MVTRQQFGSIHRLRTPSTIRNAAFEITTVARRNRPQKEAL